MMQMGQAAVGEQRVRSGSEVKKGIVHANDSRDLSMIIITY